MINPPLEIRQTYAQIREDVILLHLRWGIILDFYGEDGRTKPYLKQLSSIFFDRVLRGDLLAQQALGIARLLDPTDSNVRETSKKGAKTPARWVKRYNTSLKRFIQQVEHVNPELAEKLRGHLNNIIKKSGNTEFWRNKWGAHRDESTMRRLRTPYARSRVRLKKAEVESVLQNLALFLNEFGAIYYNVEINVGKLTKREKEHLQYIMINAPEDYTNFFHPLEFQSLKQKLLEASTA